MATAMTPWPTTPSSLRTNSTKSQIQKQRSDGPPTSAAKQDQKNKENIELILYIYWPIRLVSSNFVQASTSGAWFSMDQPSSSSEGFRLEGDGERKDGIPTTWLLHARSWMSINGYRRRPRLCGDESLVRPRHTTYVYRIYKSIWLVVREQNFWSINVLYTINLINFFFIFFSFSTFYCNKTF